MSEKLSPEALRMCRQCDNRNKDSTCKNVSVEIQNKRAKNRLCTRAAIYGGTLGLPYHKMETILGNMVQLGNNDWIFEGKNYNRLPKDHIDTDSNEWPT